MAGVWLKLALISFIFSAWLLWQRYYNPNRLFFTGPPPVVTSKFGFWPERLVIPDLGIDLPVIPSQIKSGVWETTPVGVSYLITSARPGETGNSIFYGHNWPRLLGNLKSITPGESILLYGKNGVLAFRVAQTLTVSPRQIEVLASKSISQLIIYTCIGFADRERFVVIAFTQ